MRTPHAETPHHTLHPPYRPQVLSSTRKPGDQNTRLMTIIVLHVRFDLSLSSSSFRIKKGIIASLLMRIGFLGDGSGAGGDARFLYMVPIKSRSATFCATRTLSTRASRSSYRQDHAARVSGFSSIWSKRESRRPHFRSQMPLTALAVRHEDARLRCACVRFLTPAWPDCSMTARGRHLREEITLSVAGLSRGDTGRKRPGTTRRIGLQV